MKIITLLIILTFVGEESKAGQANSAAYGAATAAIVGVAATSAMGGKTLMGKTCHNPTLVALCAIGAGLIVTAITNVGQGGEYSHTGDQITSSTGGSTDGAGPALDPYMQSIVDEAQQIAAKNGTSLSKLASQANSGSGGGMGGGPGSLPEIPSDIKEAMNKAAKDAMAHYHVAAVGTEGGGGGGARRGNGGEDGMDLNALLAGLQPGRGPASVEGLQKTMNGDPIGVAGDNIFKQVTRRYQSKISAQTFLQHK